MTNVKHMETDREIAVDAHPHSAYTTVFGAERLAMSPFGRSAHPNYFRRSGYARSWEPHMWDKRDWEAYFEIAKTPGRRRRPPRPICPSETNRILPAIGFSLTELDDAGIDVEIAERLGLPVDAGRIGAYGPNVSSLREFARAARHPGTRHPGV